MSTDSERALVLADLIKPMLAGQPPEIIGGALCELVSLFFGFHHPEIRPEIKRLWLEMLDEMLQVNSLPAERFAVTDPDERK